MIHGWTFNELLFLAGFGGIVMNLHHIFFLNIYSLGEQYIVEGRLDRFLVRPLNPLFQVYADGVSDDNVSKLLANIGIVLYAGNQIGATLLTLDKLVYGVFAVISGVLVFASAYLTFATTAFWTGRSKAAIWILFRLSDFRRYPYGIYMLPVQVLLATLVPIAFATFFPATYFLGMGRWTVWQLVSLLAGPVLFGLAYLFWRVGLSNYSSTGS
ncbi:MAG: ABC-2 family transporter protein, partial [Candidatus Nanohaloarchaea archaeon]|nr:ABC-2 family transporter protein [Candidatus Nanohaloarchaea archaeon]